MAQFSFGASGYPLTWTHLDNKSKIEIMEQTNQGIMNMLKQLCRMFTPKYLLPFASFFELVNPEHRDYVHFSKRNNHQHIFDNLNSFPLKILDLLPGEVWNGNNDSISRIPNREYYQIQNNKELFLNDTFKNDDIKKFLPQKFDISAQEIIDYFQEFSRSKLANDVGKTSILLTAKNKEREICILIKFNDGIISCDVVTNHVAAELEITCPGEILQEIIQKDLSWDEAHIGYWCKFTRNPDIYNIALWKLLYAPWQARKNFESISQNDLKIKLETPIASIIEKIGTNAIQVFEKYGLYCTGCSSSLGENVDEGCNIHGISDENKQKLIDELVRLYKNNYSKTAYEV